MNLKRYTNNIFIQATVNCAEMNINQRRDRHMDHNHETGEFRNICCKSCNARKSDNKIPSTNTSGHKNIYKQIEPTCKQGFLWSFRVTIDGKRKQIKTCVDLEKLIKIRDQWFKEHPNYYT